METLYEEEKKKWKTSQVGIAKVQGRSLGSAVDGRD